MNPLFLAGLVPLLSNLLGNGQPQPTLQPAHPPAAVCPLCGQQTAAILQPLPSLPAAQLPPAAPLAVGGGYVRQEDAIAAVIRALMTPPPALTENPDTEKQEAPKNDTSQQRGGNP